MEWDLPSIQKRLAEIQYLPPAERLPLQQALMQKQRDVASNLMALDQDPIAQGPQIGEEIDYGQRTARREAAFQKSQRLGQEMAARQSEQEAERLRSGYIPRERPLIGGFGNEPGGFASFGHEAGERPILDTGLEAWMPVVDAAMLAGMIPGARRPSRVAGYPGDTGFAPGLGAGGKADYPHRGVPAAPTPAARTPERAAAGAFRAIGEPKPRPGSREEGTAGYGWSPEREAALAKREARGRLQARVRASNATKRTEARRRRRAERPEREREAQVRGGRPVPGPKQHPTAPETGRGKPGQHAQPYPSEVAEPRGPGTPGEGSRMPGVQRHPAAEAMHMPGRRGLEYDVGYPGVGLTREAALEAAGIGGPGRIGKHSDSPQRQIDLRANRQKKEAFDAIADDVMNTMESQMGRDFRLTETNMRREGVWEEVLRLYRGGAVGQGKGTFGDAWMEGAARQGAKASAGKLSGDKWVAEEPIWPRKLPGEL